MTIVSKIPSEKFSNLTYKGYLIFNSKSDAIRFIRSIGFKSLPLENERQFLFRLARTYGRLLEEKERREKEEIKKREKELKQDIKDFIKNINNLEKLDQNEERKKYKICSNILKTKREVKENLGITIQKTEVTSNNLFSQILNNPYVKCLNKYLDKHLIIINNILKKYDVKEFKILVAYNPLKKNYFDKDYNNHYDKISFNPMWSTQENIENIDNFLPNQMVRDPVRFSNIKIRVNDRLTINDINIAVTQHFISIPVVYTVIQYKVLTASQRGLNFKNFVKSLLAFKPCTNQQFHRITQCSTTKSRKCIYQTYYYLYRDNKNIKKNEENINNELKNENDKIKEYIRKGELCNFLSEKSKIHNEPMYVDFFKGNISFKILPNGQIEEIKDRKELENKKVFLYDNEHVAPRKNIIDDKLYNDKKKNKKKNFSLKVKNSKKGYKVKDIYSFDYETYCGDNFEAIPFSLGLTNGNDNKKEFYGKNITNDFCDILDSIKTEVDTSKSHQKKKVDRILMYGFNNSRFDNTFLFDELLNRNPSCKYIIMDNSIKYIRYHNIFIYDINLFYIGSLKTVAKSFKLDISKGVYPYTFPNGNNLDYIGKVPDIKYWKKSSDYYKYIKENGNEFNLKEYTKKYCMLDCELTLKIVKIHLEQSIGVIKGKQFDVRFCPTGANLSLKLFNQVFQKEDLYASPKNIQKLERKAYKGGRTEVFKKVYKQTGIDLLGYYDLNSSYPYAMTYPMPYRYIKSITLDEPKKINDNLLFDTNLYLAKSEYKGNNPYFIPNLLMRSNMGDIIGLKNIEWSYHWGCELREAINNECEIYIKEIHEYEAKIIFKDFSEYLYEERLKCKLTNPAKGNFCKLVMNSLYGKWGQNIKTSNKLCRNIEEIEMIIRNPDCKIIDYELVGEKVLIKYKNIDDENNSVGNLVRFASYIAALARSNLSKMMTDVGHENVYYCDTDSIFTNKKPSDELIDQSKLGKWKLEKEEIKLKDGTKKSVDAYYKEANFLAPKTYMKILNTEKSYEVKDKEGNKKQIEVDGEQIFMKAKGQPSDKLEKEYYYDAMDNKDVLIKNDAMFFRKLNSITIKPQDRTLNTIYNKRIWEGNDSKPYDNIYDWYKNKYGKVLTYKDNENYNKS